MHNNQPANAGSQADLARALIKALGLPQNVTKLSITLAAGKPVLVECQCLPEIDAGSVGLIASMGGVFELHPVSESA